MDENSAVVQRIKELYDKAKSLYDKVLTNRTNINKHLSDFIVGDSLGSGVYGYTPTASNGPDVFVPQDVSAYDEAITEIQDDISDINVLSNVLNQVKGSFQEIHLDEELEKIYENVNDMIDDVSGQIPTREELLERIKKIREIIAEQMAEAARQNEGIGGGAIGGGASGYTGGGGYDYGGGGSAGGTSGGDTYADTGIVPDAVTRPPVGDYQSMITVPTVVDATSITNTETNIGKLEADVGNILGHVVLNGVAIGSDVYPVGDLAMPDSDIGFDFMALQMALDYVKGDIEATKDLISQIKTEMENNNTKISEAQAKMQEYDEVATYDDEGNYTGSYKVPKYDNAALQADIDALTKINEELQEKVDAYTEKQAKKEGVFDELISVRNAYNSAYDGLTNVFTAASGLDAVSHMGADNSLYGVKLSDNQLKGLFTNLGSALESGRSNFSLKSDGSIDITKGEFSLSNFDYLVSSCAALGNNSKSFTDNLKSFIKGDQNRASALNTSEGLRSGGSPFVDSPTSSAEEKNDDNLSSSLDQIQGQIQQSLSVTSDVVVEARVQNFMEENQGKTVIVPNTVRQILGLQTEGLLSVPTGYDVHTAYPFLYWLVGTGHAAGGGEHLKTASFAKSLANGRYQNNDAIIYIPGRWGNGQAEASTYNGSMLNHDLHNIVNGLNIDRNRISGAGSSVGAFALAYLVDSNPNLFSSVAMTGGGFGGPWGNVTIDKAIQGSPNTTFIWYMADNDETSHASNGDGVHTYTLKQHQQLQAAGINSVYYEIGGGIWHTNACDRFASRNLIYDLTHIVKGQKLAIQSGVKKISPTVSLEGSIDHNKNGSDWYDSLATQTVQI